MIRTLPAISLWQPWASLLFVEGGKVHETRDWDVPRRIFGRTVLVHAAKHPITRTTVEDDDPLAILCTHRFGPDWRKALPFGAFVGTARISGSLRMPRATPASPVDEIAGNWEPGRYAWRMDERMPLAEPIPAKGQQGWWMAEVEL